MAKLYGYLTGVAVTAWLSAGSVFAQTPWADWDYKFDREITPWSEVEQQIPAYPADENLIPLDIGSATPHKFYVDAKSLSVGGDGVVRYSFVIKTSGGATNVSFEGIRCETQEQKYYAIGRSNKTWVRARNPRWRTIQPHEISPYHFTLYADFACSGKLVAGTAQQIVEKLRRGPA